MSATSKIGIIGGSGFYSLFEGAEQLDVETPWGAPSSPVTIGELNGREVAFITRHGLHHELPPHRVPYRANIAALSSLGVERVYAPCAVGSLRPDIHPGDFVIGDQLVDLTSGRDRTFYDDRTVHISFADPYCPELREAAIAASLAEGITTHERGTIVTVSGPRFSTRAESTWYRSAGWDVINMTQCPEAALARELGMCYAAVALVTDYDTGVQHDPHVEPVTADAVFAVLASMVRTVTSVLAAAIASVPSPQSCSCADQKPTD